MKLDATRRSSVQKPLRDYDRPVTGFELRRAVPQDAAAAAEVWLQARHAATKYIPAPVHTDDDVRG